MKEWQLQAYVADLLRLTPRRGVLWMHIPNEGLRAARTGAFLKRLGMVPGAADFLIVIPPGQAHFLELKTAKGRQSAGQRAFADWAAASGARYAVVRSPEEARKLLAEWGALVTIGRRQDGSQTTRRPDCPDGSDSGGVCRADA